jgi:predicted TIM-barrel fold metal-dependent hydrolase
MAHWHRQDCPLADGSGLSRRALLGTLTALGAGSVVPGFARGEPADALDPAPRRIDVHHHFFPPAWLEHAAQKPPGPAPMMREWTPARVLEHMDKSGVATAIASLSPWGVAFAGVAELPKLARVCNDSAAQMIRDHPGRFGLFAAMPLPDVDASLKEITYALDTLKADGIGMMTSYGDKWPGDPMFLPVMEELERRKAVIYFHPTTASCCGNLVPGVAPATIEWPVDTARAVLSLLFSGSLVRYPNIRFIFSHAGGALPALSGRIANFVKRDKNAEKYAPQGALAEFVKLYYDTANASAAPSMAALMAMAPPSQIVYGSDYPYFSLEENVEGLAKIRMNAADRQALNRGNVARILPKYAA